MADSAAQKKPGFIAKTKKFCKDIIGETKKIVWPGKQTTVNNTIIVLTVVVIAAIFVGCFDAIASLLVNLFLGFLKTL